MFICTFLFYRPDKVTVNYFFADLFQAANNGVTFLFSQDAALRQHGGMSDRALNILLGHALVKIDRSGKHLNKSVGCLGKRGTGKFFGINGSHYDFDAD